MNKVVLAYSGGLDTSIIAKWLQETYNCEVVTFTADIGQGEEVEPARAKAEAMGIKEIYIEDLREFLKLCGAGQFSVDEQVGDFDEVRLRRELLDGIAPVAQDALLTIQVGDRAGASARVGVTGVERDRPRLRPELRDVDANLVFGTHHHRQFHRLSLNLDACSFCHALPKSIDHRAFLPSPPESFKCQYCDQVGSQGQVHSGFGIKGTWRKWTPSAGERVLTTTPSERGTVRNASSNARPMPRRLNSTPVPM